MSKYWWFLVILVAILIFVLTRENAKKKLLNNPEESDMNNAQLSPAESSVPESAEASSVSEAEVLSSAAEPEQTETKEISADVPSSEPILEIDVPPVPEDQSRTTAEYVEWLQSGEAFQAPAAPDLAAEFFESPEFTGDPAEPEQPEDTSSFD